MCLVGSDGGGGLLSDTAEILAHLDTDVTVLTPGSTPAVADAPVVDTALGAPAGQLDAVVEGGTAVLGDDTAGVCLPGDGVDADGERGLHLSHTRICG
jgi:hypothetical protein